MKKFITLFLVLTLLLVGCGSGSGTSSDKMKVGMVTDSGTIDDKSFNEGTWKGIELAKKELGIQERYLQPDGETTSDYLTKIKDLYDSGYKLIVTPGFKFEEAIFEAQDLYKDAKFVIIDGAPTKAGETMVGDNTRAIFFAEEQAGFMAAIATAIERPEANVGFIGGMEIPPVQKFNWGFQQGVKYANENLGTNVKMEKNNVVYQGTFNEVQAGQQLAGKMYDSGVDVIFHAAGGVGVGIINEAKQRANNGEDVWVVGVDSDQYESGIYTTGKSVVLTSAVKRVDLAAFDAIEDELNGKFESGIVTLTAVENAVGIPEENPNLSSETYTKTMEVYKKVQSGEIVIEGGDNVKPASVDFK